MDFPGAPGLPTHISTYSSLGVGRAGRPLISGFSAGTGSWPAANLAIYCPLFLPWRYPVTRMFWANGSTITSGHVDIGIFAPGGGAVWTAGSTAQAGAQALQYVTTSGFELDPGWWYIGLSMDATTSHAFGSNTGTSVGRLVGLVQQASAFPLPSPATFAQFSQAGGVQVQLCGITRTASGF